MPGNWPRQLERRLRGRYVFSAAGPPIPGGVVTFRGRRIVAVGDDRGAAGLEDLGNVALLPGLVNAHTHLEFSDLDRPLGQAGIRLDEWIRLLMDRRRSRANCHPEGTRRGLEECIRTGTTTLGEIAQPAWPVDAFEAATIQAVVFLELIAARAESVAPALALAEDHRQVRPSNRWLPGLGPHAPYTVRLELLDRVVALSAARRIPLAFHLAESREELELLATGTGPMADFLRGLETWDPGVAARATRPLDYLRRLAAADRVLVVHGNYLDGEEIAFLAQNQARMTVVYCPRTHAFFGHDHYPLSPMLAAGVPVCLGTDSRASSPDLSILAEMRAVSRKHPAVDPRIVLELATLCGAKALGLEREMGSLEQGKCADLAAVALPDWDSPDPYELLLDSELPVVTTWHNGEQVFPRPESR
ncbi:MAG: amidohydrolase family protein [Pirellulales bacterium]|nr:amidohydrolase family protein [Pirellulales bacterium]